MFDYTDQLKTLFHVMLKQHSLVCLSCASEGVVTEPVSFIAYNHGVFYYCRTHYDEALQEFQARLLVDTMREGLPE